MGKESVQIRRHIEEERARLEANVGKLESDWDAAKELATRCLTSPRAFAETAVEIGRMLKHQAGRRRHAQGSG